MESRVLFPLLLYIFFFLKERIALHTALLAVKSTSEALSSTLTSNHISSNRQARKERLTKLTRPSESEPWFSWSTRELALELSAISPHELTKPNYNPKTNQEHAKIHETKNKPRSKQGLDPNRRLPTYLQYHYPNVSAQLDKEAFWSNSNYREKNLMIRYSREWIQNPSALFSRSKSDNNQRQQ